MKNMKMTKRFFMVLCAAMIMLVMVSCNSSPEQPEGSEWQPGVTEWTDEEGNLHYTIHHPEKDGVLFAVITGPDGITTYKAYVEKNRVDFISIDAAGEITRWSRDIPLEEVWLLTDEKSVSIPSE